MTQQRPVERFGAADQMPTIVLSLATRFASPMVVGMVAYDETHGAVQPLTGRDGGLFLPPPVVSCEAPDWQALYEEQRARADAAEARVKELTWAETSTRSRAGMLKWHFDRTPGQLAAAVKEVKEATASHREVASLNREIVRQGEMIETFQTRCAEQEAELAKLRGTQAKLSKTAFGAKSEKQQKNGTGKKRGLQRGASGHGRTPRPSLPDKEERHDPSASGRVCPCCGEAHVANGSHESAVMEIEGKSMPSTSSHCMQDEGDQLSMECELTTEHLSVDRMAARCSLRCIILCIVAGTFATVHKS